MAERREGRIRRLITQRLRAAGWLVVRTDAARNHSLRKGWPDLLAIRKVKWDGTVHGMSRAKIIMLEVKTPYYRSGSKVYPAGRVSKAQQDCHEWLRGMGYEVRVVRSLDDIADMLKSTMS